ncbi:MAG: hypothetical protein JW854_15220 [Actinobacteria bacterium]|nr:hypothetical protein [Actinomycetota bacterium]
MLTSRTFIIFLIPVAILGLFIWFATTLEVDRSNVQVAGTLVSSIDVEVSVNSSRLTSESGTRKLIVEMDSQNDSSTCVNLNPNKFHLVLVPNENPTGSGAAEQVFIPMRYTSSCEEAPASLSAIPVGAVRSVTLVFYGEALPSGEEWDDYHLSLEYYDPSTPLMLSNLLSPTEE